MTDVASHDVLIALLVSVLGGFVLLGPAVHLMRQSSKIDARYDKDDERQPMFNWSIFWLGGTERAIATTLFIYAPSQLALFIGGWTAFKIAAGWGRPGLAANPSGHMSALIGTAWSFGIAIGAGLWANPHSLRVLEGG